MLGAARWTLVPALVFGWLLWPGTAQAIVPQVRDEGKFFSAEAVSKANAKIQKIQDLYKKDLFIETHAEIPQDVVKRRGYDGKNREAFFENWVADVAVNNKINGIVVILSKDQFNEGRGRAQVGVGKNTIKRDFTATNRDHLTKIFTDDLKDKQFDKALLDGVAYVEKILSQNHIEAAAAKSPPGTAPPRSTPARGSDLGAGSGILGWVCIGAFVLLGIWLVKGLFRAFSGGGAGGMGGGGYGGGPGYGYGGGGGGGFMSGLMGGLFGAVAGNWIYNNMFGGSSYHQSTWGESTAHGGEPSQPSSDDASASDQGQGFTSSGGDVDSGGGGDGDAGGGGGGDWGGGGGGGDWGGGGGGDWGGGGGGGGGDW